MKTISLAVILVCMPMLTHAGNTGTTYLGLNYHKGTYTSAVSSSLSFNPGALGVKAGKYITNNIAIEGSLLIGQSSATDTINLLFYGDATWAMEINNILSLFIKGDVLSSDKFSAFGFLGFSKASLDVKGDTPNLKSVSYDDNDLSYGIGGELMLSDDLSINIEYIQYTTGADEYSASGSGDYKYSGINAGISKRF